MPVLTHSSYYMYQLVWVGDMKIANLQEVVIKIFYNIHT